MLHSQNAKQQPAIAETEESKRQEKVSSLIKAQINLGYKPKEIRPLYAERYISLSLSYSGKTKGVDIPATLILEWQDMPTIVQTLRDKNYLIGDIPIDC